MAEKMYTFSISTDHGHTRQVAAIMGETEALKHAFRIAGESGRLSYTYPDRYVVQSTAETEIGHRWFWIIEDND